MESLLVWSLSLLLQLDWLLGCANPSKWFFQYISRLSLADQVLTVRPQVATAATTITTIAKGQTLQSSQLDPTLSTQPYTTSAHPVPAIPRHSAAILTRPTPNPVHHPRLPSSGQSARPLQPPTRSRQRATLSSPSSTMSTCSSSTATWTASD